MLTLLLVGLAYRALVQKSSLYPNSIIELAFCQGQVLRFKHFILIYQFIGYCVNPVRDWRLRINLNTFFDKKNQEETKGESNL
jgi:hypothetical protein